jgi:beta-lactamase regulating signal transducer with metallopeptidase domain
MHSLITIVSNSIQNSRFTALFFDAALKGLVVLALAGGVCALWRRASAATRHLIWFLAVASLPFLPLCTSVLPSWQRPLWSVSTSLNSGNQVSLTLELAPTAKFGTSSQVAAGSPNVAGTSSAVSRQSGGSRQIAAQFSASWLAIAFIAWFGGMVLLMIYWVLGRFRLGKISRMARPLRGNDWAVLLQEACEALGLGRAVQLLQSADDVMPMTWGWWQPVVLLPAEAEQWTADRRRIVLMHELAHVKRWDCLTQLIARVVCALYWFNPFVWLAARRMCVERERACDDLVLNGGCKASDYAGHLLEIARSFRRMPQVAAIAMARPSGLEKRVAAIVDASRRRRLRPAVMAAIMISVGATIFCIGGCKTNTVSSGTADSNALRQQQIARLEAFSAAKEKQSRTLAAVAGEEISPVFQRFFDAAKRGDLQTVTNMYAGFRKSHPQYEREPGVAEDIRLRTSYWGPVLEIWLAYEHVVKCEPKYTQMAVDDMINSIPAGSIYFGGTDPGRGLPTAFCKSHEDADPFYTVTQNALADSTYLEYMQRTYGNQKELLPQLIEAARADGELKKLEADLRKAEQTQAELSVQQLKLPPTQPDDPAYKAAEEAVRRLDQQVRDRVEAILATVQSHSKEPAGSKTIYIPTAEDSRKCFQDYIADAQNRLMHDQQFPDEPKQVKPGEGIKFAKDESGQQRVQVSGQIAVMSINGLMTKIIFDKNPGHEFYVEESFPLDWMFPYLEPHGLIMKINRQPLPELSEETLQQDHEYWRSRVAGMIGDWLNDGTSVQAVTDFAEKIHVRKDLSGFDGDPRFVQNDYACKCFSKWRSSIAGIYNWRIGQSPGGGSVPAQYLAQTGPARSLMVREADFAYKQAFALCPYSPEATFRYVNFLLNEKRNSDAILIAETASHVDQENDQLKDLVKRLKGMAKTGVEGGK